MRSHKISRIKSNTQMKKSYTSPQIQIITLEASQLLASSTDQPNSFELNRDVDTNEEYTRKKSIWD